MHAHHARRGRARLRLAAGQGHSDFTDNRRHLVGRPSRKTKDTSRLRFIVPAKLRNKLNRGRNFVRVRSEVVGDVRMPWDKMKLNHLAQERLTH